jgi:hypothetical protein
MLQRRSQSLCQHSLLTRNSAAVTGSSDRVLGQLHSHAARSPVQIPPGWISDSVLHMAYRKWVSRAGTYRAFLTEHSCTGQLTLPAIEPSKHGTFNFGVNLWPSGYRAIQQS